MTEIGNTGGSQNWSRSQLTAEEVAVIQECGRECFYYRSLPLACASALATHALMRAGRIKVGRYGGAPKWIAAGAVGYFVGKLSYMSVVRERVLALPDSRLADMMRAGGGRSRGGNEAALAEVGPAGAEVGLAPLDRRQTDLVAGLDDIYRPTLDSVSPVDGHQLGSDDLPAAQSATSYQRLRQLNRADYEGAARTGADDRSRQQQPPPVQRPSPAGPPARTNKYGDAWE